MSKFRNTPTTVELSGHGRKSFHSKREAMRAQELSLMEARGVISGLRFQPRYKIEVNGIKICTYIADFEYVDGGQTIVEDVKGVRTQIYLLKRRLMEACLGVKIIET
jgi:hypothetical protein